MPSAPKRHSATISGRAHKSPKEKDRRSKRKYSYSSKAWQSIRTRQLSQKPLCEHCLADDRVTPATDVDHIDNDSHNNEPGNLQSLCHSHHSKKTYEHDGAFGR